MRGTEPVLGRRRMRERQTWPSAPRSGCACARQGDRWSHTGGREVARGGFGRSAEALLYGVEPAMKVGLEVYPTV